MRADPERKSSEGRAGYFRPKLGKGGQQQPSPKSVVTTREDQHSRARDGQLEQAHVADTYFEVNFDSVLNTFF